MKKDIYKTTFVYSGMGLIIMLGMMCGLLAFDASQHTASAATHSIQASHHAQDSNGKSPSKRSTSRSHYTTTHHYYSSRGSGSPFDITTSIVILVVCVVIGIFFAIYKRQRQDDYNDE